MATLLTTKNWSVHWDISRQQFEQIIWDLEIQIFSDLFLVVKARDFRTPYNPNDKTLVRWFWYQSSSRLSRLKEETKIHISLLKKNSMETIRNSFKSSPAGNFPVNSPGNQNGQRLVDQQTFVVSQNYKVGFWKLWKALGLVDARSLFPQNYTSWKIPTTYTVSILPNGGLILSIWEQYFGQFLVDLGHFSLIRGIQNPRDSHGILIDVISNPSFWFMCRVTTV